jgi:antitoxin ParD1/3/4
MDQMNVSVTDEIAGYVRKKVKSGRYNNASEVVREALRRMEEEDARAIRLAKPTVEDILGDLTGEQLDGIRQRVRTGIAAIESGRFKEYAGNEGLRDFAGEIKSRGRKLVGRRASRPQSSGR